MAGSDRTTAATGELAAKSGAGADRDRRGRLIGARLKQRAGGKAGVQCWRFHSRKGIRVSFSHFQTLAFSDCDPSLLNSSMISCG